MPKIEGIKELKATLKQLRKGSSRRDNGSVVVGYTAGYALFVHENVEMKLKGQERKGEDAEGKYWDPQGRGQAKFLEQPVRTLTSELRKIVEKATPRIGLIKSLLLAALRIQRESQKLVPVDTGNLKASAFTVIDKGGEVSISTGPTNI